LPGVDSFTRPFFATALLGAAVFFADFFGAGRFRACFFAGLFIAFFLVCVFFGVAAFFDFVDLFLVFFLVAIRAV
jgi:hypothetical protein